MESKGGALLVTGGEENLPVSGVHRVLGAPVVEARFAPHVEQDLAAHALDPPNQHPPLVKRRPPTGMKSDTSATPAAESHRVIRTLVSGRYSCFCADRTGLAR